MPATYAVTVDGVSKAIQLGWTIQHPANGVKVLTCDIKSVAGTYRPVLGDEVILTENATTIFGGTIQAMRERGILDSGGVPILTELTVMGFTSFAARRFVNGSIVAGTLKAALEFLVVYLADYGVTLHGSQVNGPSLEAQSWAWVKLTDVFDGLANLTGYVWDIDDTKVLRFYAPGSVSAPFSITTANRNAIGDIEVEPSRSDLYANRVIANLPPHSVENFPETWTGDGVTTVFNLASVTTESQTRGLVTNDGIEQTLSDIGQGGMWEFDPAASPQTITAVLVPAPANGVPISLIVFTGVLSISAQAEDAGEIAANGLWEIVIAVQDITTQVAAQAIADAELARRLEAQRTVRYSTDLVGLKPGQTQTITVSERNLSGTFLLTEVVTANIQANHVRRSVTAIEASRVLWNWRDTIKQWSDGGNAGVSAGSIIQGGGGGTGIGMLTGIGNPQGVVTAVVGMLYLDSANGYVYRKMAGSGNTGWYYFHIPGAGGGLGPQWTSLSASTIASGAPVHDGSGFGAPGTTNMGVPVAFATTWYVEAGTNTSTGTRGGWESGAFTVPWFDFDFDFTCQVRTHSTFTDGRIVVGLTTATLTNSDTLPGKGLAFRYSQGVDSGWMGVKHDGSTQSLTAQVAAIAVSTAYHLRIRFLRATNTVYFSVNDGAEVSSTANVPAAGTNISAFMYVYNKNATTQKLFFRHAGMTYPGVAA